MAAWQAVRGGQGGVAGDALGRIRVRRRSATRGRQRGGDAAWAWERRGGAAQSAVPLQARAVNDGTGVIDEVFFCGVKEEQLLPCCVAYERSSSIPARFPYGNSKAGGHVPEHV
jgi:hypothetical protein